MISWCQCFFISSFKNFPLLFEQYPNNYIRMGEKQPVTQPWLRLQVLWSLSVAFKCGPEGHFEAICPKYTPCTGARNQGANLFILSHLYWFILFFSFYVWFNFGFPHSTHVKPYFTPHWILMHPKWNYNN